MSNKNAAILEIKNLKKQISDLESHNRELVASGKNLMRAVKIAQLTEQAANLGVWTWNAGSGKIMWSDNMCRIHGIKSRAFNGTLETALSRIYPDDREYVQSELQAAISKKQRKDIIYRVAPINGKTIVLKSQYELYYDDNGALEEIVGFVRDITEQKKAEDRLKESEERFRGLVETAPVGIVIHQEGKIAFVNRRFKESLGYADDTELLGKPVIELVHPAQRKIVRKRIQEIIATGKPAPLIEEKLLSRDGSSKYALVSSAPITYHNQPAFEVSIIDLTDLKKSEKALMESEERFRTFFEDSLDSVYITTIKGNRLQVNQAFMDLFGYTAEEILKLSPVDLYVDPGDREYFLKQIAKKGRVINYPLFMKKKDGSKLHCIETASLRKNSRGTIIGHQGIIRDITKEVKTKQNLESALQEAQRANKVKSLFLTNMSHEIRTPLNSLLGFVQLLENASSQYLSEEEKSFFDIIQNSGMRIINTIHGILDISEIEAGAYSPTLEEYHLIAVVRSIAEAFRTQAETKGLSLTITTEPCDDRIIGDEYSLTQAIFNLIDNAVKYTERGSVNVLLSARGKKLILKIRDTGIGISPAFQKRLYEPFSQESEGYSKKYQGIGLGLALTKRYLSVNGADISVKSTKGRGTEFSIKFKRIAKS